MFSKGRAWGSSRLSAALVIGATSMSVINAQDLMGASTTGSVYVGQMTVTVTAVNFGTNTLAVTGVTKAVSLRVWLLVR